MFDPFSDKTMLEQLKIPDTYFKGKTYEYQYHFRHLLQCIDSSLKFIGLPEEWPEDVFKFCLWARGYVAVFKTEQWGLAFQPVTALSGISFYWEPTTVNISNPHFNKTFTLHKDCELIKICPDYRGCLDIIDHFATRLAELTKSIQMQYIGAKTPMAMIANSKAEADLIKSIYDTVQEGNTLVVYKNKLSDNEMIPRKDPFGLFQNDFNKTWIGLDLLQALTTEIDNFYQAIGIPSTVNKKSHMLNAEADFQSSQSSARLQCWLANLNESFERVEKMFGLHLEVEQNAQTEDNLEDDGDASSQNAERSPRKLESKKR